jgi:uncharacterized protein YycO
MSLLSFIEPVSKLVGKIHAPFSTRLITGKDFYSIQSQLQPGDILLSRIRLHLTNLFIEDFWKHAAIAINELEIIEATAEGVHLSSVYDFISTKDYICVLRLNSIFPAHLKAKAASSARKALGVQYDYEFDLQDNEFYCSELVDWSYQQNDIQLVPYVESMGIKSILPSAFYRAINKLDLIYTSDSAKNISRY